VVGRDGNPITLIQGVADVMVLAVSPDRSHLAIATSEEGPLSRSETYPRFIEGSAVNVIVVSTDGQESTIVVGGVSRVDATYTPDGPARNGDSQKLHDHVHRESNRRQ